jgi:multiple sugar transport system permease protein
MPAERLRRPSTLAWCAAIIVAAVMVLPFLWMLSTALMQPHDVLQYPPPLVPSAPRWRNFMEALTALPFGRFFFNSAVVALFTVVGQLLTGAMGGYALARFRFAGQRVVLALFLACLMVPGIVLLIPRFLLVDALGGVDTLAGLVSAELVSLWGVFMMRQFFVSLPRETEDAARLDGAGEWTIFLRLALPAAKPALATLGLFAFIDAWKALLWPLVVTRSMSLRTVEVGVASFHGLYYSNWPWQMAAAVTALVPLLVVFALTQRYFTRGIQLSGLR